MMDTQYFEIVALEHPDYVERMKAIDNIDDFKTLEEIFITDEYITVKMKSFDKLTELYSYTDQYKKMISLWKSITGFNSYIHFVISELGLGNNIEKAIRFVLEQRGYPFDGFWSRWNVRKKKNEIFQKVVDVILTPIKDGDQIELRYRSDGYGHSFVQYHYEMVIKILVQTENGELDHDYVYVRIWNAHPDSYDRFSEKLNYEVEE